MLDEVAVAAVGLGGIEAAVEYFPVDLGMVEGRKSMTADELAAAVGTEAATQLEKALDRIKHCLAQLSDEQVWWRPQPSLNSIGNLILHLCGNVRQWVVSG